MKIGIIGAGNIGGTLGALWAAAGHRIRFGTREPSRVIAGLGAAAGPSMEAGTPAEAAEFGEVVLFAAPYGAWPEFANANEASLTGKVVIDAANPYAQRDGEIASEVKQSGLGGGGYTATLLPRSHVVKAFNTIYWSDLKNLAHREGKRVAIPFAGPAGAAVQTVTQLIEDAGFDAVVLGDLDRSSKLDPGSPLYAKSMTAAEINKLLF